MKFLSKSWKIPHESSNKKPVCEPACGKMHSKREKCSVVHVIVSGNVSEGEGMCVGVGTQLADVYLFFIARYGS